MKEYLKIDYWLKLQTTFNEHLYLSGCCQACPLVASLWFDDDYFYGLAHELATKFLSETNKTDCESFGGYLFYFKGEPREAFSTKGRRVRLEFLQWLINNFTTLIPQTDDN